MADSILDYLNFAIEFTSKIISLAENAINLIYLILILIWIVKKIIKR